MYICWYFDWQELSLCDGCLKWCLCCFIKIKYVQFQKFEYSNEMLICKNVNVSMLKFEIDRNNVIGILIIFIFSILLGFKYDINVLGCQF